MRDGDPGNEVSDVMPTRISRRAALGGAAALAGLAGVSVPPASIAASSERSPEKSTVVASRDNAVVETAAGRVRGYTRNGVHAFKGIPYAQSTAGPNRFLPSVQVKPWSGIRSCFHYGEVSPQPAR